MAKGKMNWLKLEKENRIVKQGQIPYKGLMETMPPETNGNEPKGYQPDQFKVCPYCSAKFLYVLLEEHILLKHSEQIGSHNFATDNNIITQIKSIKATGIRGIGAICPQCNLIIAQDEFLEHLITIHKVEPKRIVIKEEFVKCRICQQLVKVQDQIRHFIQTHRV